MDIRRGATPLVKAREMLGADLLPVLEEDEGLL